MSCAVAEVTNRRIERRLQQRAANLGRALKMRAARLVFQAPPPPSPQLPFYNVGCSGWFYWDWKGPFYPATLPTNQWFPHYAQNFGTVELNAPFYSWPTVATVKSWIRQAGERNFVYTIKVCELITHVKRFQATKTLVRDFGLIGDLLGERMGCFLFQLPPSFDYSASRLRNILSQLDPRRRNVLEFRHKSWWNPKVFDALQQNGVIFCSCSAPNLPDELICTSSEIYVRFHGPEKWYRHDYQEAELAAWVERIRRCDCDRVWAYFNNDYGANAVRNAKLLIGQLTAQT